MTMVACAHTSRWIHYFSFLIHHFGIPTDPMIRITLASMNQLPQVYIYNRPEFVAVPQTLYPVSNNYIKYNVIVLKREGIK
jgi:hypothetical protein